MDKNNNIKDRGYFKPDAVIESRTTNPSTQQIIFLETFPQDERLFTSRKKRRKD